MEIHQGKGHWMDRQDAKALPWMAGFVRHLRPKRVVWLQDDVTHSRFYWLAAEEPVPRSRVEVELSGQTITLLGAQNLSQLILRLDDSMLDLKQPVVVMQGEQKLFEGQVPRTLAVLVKTLQERGDPTGVWCSELKLDLEPQESGG